MTVKRQYQVQVEANFTMLALSPSDVTEKVKKVLKREGFTDAGWEILVDRYRQNRGVGGDGDAPESVQDAPKQAVAEKPSPVDHRNSKKVRNKASSTMIRKGHTPKSFQNRKKRGSK